MTTMTMTQPAAAANSAGIIYIILRPVDVFVGKLLACNCFDAAQKREIQLWLEIFSKKYPEVPKEESAREDAADRLLYLLVAYIIPNKSDPKLMAEFQEGIEKLLGMYLPKGTDIEATITEYAKSYLEEEDVASVSAMESEVQEKALAQLEAMRQAADASTDAQFEIIKTLINEFIKTKQDKTVQAGQRVQALLDKIEKIKSANLEQGGEQSKIIASLDKLAITHKKTFEAAQSLEPAKK
jgi:hypothetical protein